METAIVKELSAVWRARSCLWHATNASCLWGESPQLSNLICIHVDVVTCHTQKKPFDYDTMVIKGKIGYDYFTIDNKNNFHFRVTDIVDSRAGVMKVSIAGIIFYGSSSFMVAYNLMLPFPTRIFKLISRVSLSLSICHLLSWSVNKYLHSLRPLGFCEACVTLKTNSDTCKYP